VVLLDFAVYVQHVISHKVPILWRLHKVHHADRDVDATTGVRFHPVEALLSMIYKSAIVLLLGPAAMAVVVFEIILNASAMFNHANLRLPSSLDKVLRSLFVTPDMHSVHHSVIVHETDSNYGFFLSIWDKLFKTYTANPSLTPDKINIGLNEYQTDNPSSLGWSLALPFRATSKS
jgi:sterol desaturase/sphingolipid hydroxylase (fatty acid hydroxylase superfamily)